MCLGNSHGNFQLHRFTISENIVKSFRGGLLFLTHTVCKQKMQTRVNESTHSEMGLVRQNPVQSDIVSDLKLHICNREFQSVICFMPPLVISHWRHSVLRLSVRPCVISY